MSVVSVLDHPATRQFRKPWGKLGPLARIREP